jgi:ATP-dependent protease ClpP protease subunit
MELILTGYIDNAEECKDFKQGLLDNRNQPLNMVICSGGGSVMDGLELSALIKTHEQTTKAVCVGFVASIASVIALSADKVVIDANGTMMIHNASGGNYGTSEDLRQTADQLDGFSKQIMSYYIARIAKNGKLINNNIADTETMLAECMKEERILSADDCLKMGLADKIVNAQVPLQVSDNTEVMIEQINTAYPKASAKYNFTNCFTMSIQNKEETPQPETVAQDKKGLFKAFTNAFAALLGFKNEAAIEPAEQIAEETETNIEQSQTPEEMTEEEMIQHLKAKGFDVSEAANDAPEETQPKAPAIEAKAPVAEAENSAMLKELEAMKQQLAEMKAAAEKQSFENSTRPAGSNETAKDVKATKSSALQQKVYAAIGGNLSHEIKYLK